jgi:hypothetical protein
MPIMFSVFFMLLCELSKNKAQYYRHNFLSWGKYSTDEYEMK